MKKIDYAALEKKLRAEIENEPDRPLPAMAVVARKFGVSKPVLSRVARELRRRGVVEYARGKRIRHADVEELIIGSHGRNAQEWIQQRIESGELQVGQALPKFSVLVKQFHTSNSTIVAVFYNLAKKNLVHKDRKSVV
jgi:DNA-binding GntR family transcriptional regulator